MMQGHTYLLLSQKDKRTYLGSTTDLVRRLWEHNNGKNKSTKNRGPFVIVYQERYDTIAQARTRELYLKSRNGRRELKYIFESLNLGE